MASLETQDPDTVSILAYTGFHINYSGTDGTQSFTLKSSSGSSTIGSIGTALSRMDKIVKDKERSVNDRYRYWEIFLSIGSTSLINMMRSMGDDDEEPLHLILKAGLKSDIQFVDFLRAYKDMKSSQGVPEDEAKRIALAQIYAYTSFRKIQLISPSHQKKHFDSVSDVSDDEKNAIPEVQTDESGKKYFELGDVTYILGESLEST
jgi:hypothetical protein